MGPTGSMATIFYSWQSDAPNNTNRNFIRQALVKAVESLNRTGGADIEDVIRLDQDTQGVAGSPVIVDTILAKIDTCDVFVPDVTFVPNNSARPTPNPNVMIEYGYALKAPGADRIVAVMNTHFGQPTELPFDMRYRRFPITYNLAPDASQETRRKAQKELIAKLAHAIEAVFSALPASNAKAAPQFKPSPAFDNGATFAEVNKLFPMTIEGEGDVQRRFPVGPKMFLRLMPRDAVLQVARADIRELLIASELWPLGHQRYSSFSFGNSQFGEGTVARHPADASLIGAISQIMLTREIWGVETHLLTPAASQKWHNADYAIVPSTLVRQIFEDGLTRYLRVAEKYLALPLPFVVIAGIANLENHRLALPQAYISHRTYDSTITREILIDNPGRSPAEILHPFFVALYDAFGEPFQPTQQ